MQAPHCFEHKWPIYGWQKRRISEYEMTTLMKKFFSTKAPKPKVRARVSLYFLRYLNWRKVSLEVQLCALNAAEKRVRSERSRQQSVARIETLAENGSLEELKIEIIANSNRYEASGLEFDDSLLARILNLTMKAKKSTLSFKRAKIYENDPLEEFFPVVVEDDSIDKFVAIHDWTQTRFEEISVEESLPLTPESFWPLSKRSRRIFFRNLAESNVDLFQVAHEFWNQPTTHWLQYPSSQMAASIITDWEQQFYPFINRRFTIPAKDADGILKLFKKSSFEKCSSLVSSELKTTDIPRWLEFLHEMTGGRVSCFLKGHPAHNDRFACLVEVPMVDAFPTFSALHHLIFL